MKRLLFVAVMMAMVSIMAFAQLTPQVVLAWDAPTTGGAVVSYNLYKSTVAGTLGAKVNASPITTLTYTDTAVVRGTTYLYTAKAVNATGESVGSNVLSVTVPQLVPVPGAPGNLRLISVQ